MVADQNVAVTENAQLEVTAFVARINALGLTSNEIVRLVRQELYP